MNEDEMRPEHSAACTSEMRANGECAADCERCEAWVRWLDRFVRGDKAARTETRP